MKYEAPFESSLSQHAQFQALSLFVWAFCLAIVVTAAMHWQRGHHFEPALVLPIVHLLPWCVGVIERRRVLKRYGTTQRHLGPEGICEQQESPNLQSLIRVLWGAYSTLFIVEAMLLWH